MKCARPLQLLSQFILRGSSAAKPVIVLPVPAQSAVSCHRVLI